MAEFTHRHIGKIDAKTGKVTWYPLPTANGRARRMNIDDQDRILVAEYRGNKIAMFDPATEKFTEWPLPLHTWPYRATVDKNSEIWTGGMHADRAVRLNPKTGETVEYHCRRKPTCAPCSSTVRRRRSPSGPVATTEPHWLKWNPWTNWFQETFRPPAASPRCGGGRAFLRGGGSGPRPLLVHATVRHEGAGELCTIKHHAG
jgi:hypothetical protein